MSELLSNTQLKNRLLGAALLVVLAVLLIPLFLGEPKQLAQEPVITNSADFQSKIQPLNGSNQAVDPALNNKQANNNGGLVLKKIDSIGASKPRDTTEKLSSVDIVQATKTKQLLTPKQTKEPAKKKVQPKNKPLVTAAPKSKPKPKTKKAKPILEAGWAVQAGIFSKKENAESIAKVLRANGLKPKLSNAKTSLGMATRVWVGPFKNKADAQSISIKLEKQTGNGGYVAQYPFK